MKTDYNDARDRDKECRIALKCSRKLRTQLMSVAKSRGTSVSALVVDIVKTAIEQHNINPADSIDS